VAMSLCNAARTGFAPAPAESAQVARKGLPAVEEAFLLA
jgi:hypothetical protein